MATYIRKIKCPRHYVLKPGGIPFIMERIPSLKNIKPSDAKIFGLNLWRKKKDKNGQYIQNFKDYVQPEVSPTEMRMRVWEPSHEICMGCKRCVTQ